MADNAYVQYFTKPNFKMNPKQQWTIHTHYNTPRLMGSHGRERMVVEFTTTGAISAYHH